MFEPGIYSDILSVIQYGILCGIYSDILWFGAVSIFPIFLADKQKK